MKRNLYFPVVTILLCCVCSKKMYAQTEQEKVIATILHLDSLFWNAYNSCDTGKFKDFFTSDIEFYHDKGGVTLGAEALVESLKKIFLLIPVFLIPSFLFWCSGIHKDGLIFVCVALIAFYFYKQLVNKKATFKWLLLLIICFIMLFALRNTMAFLLGPALLAWFVGYKYPGKAKLIVAGMYMLGIVMFFLSSKISPQTDLPQYVIEKQNEFNQLSGSSKIEVPVLENSVISFIKFFPTAMDIAFFRPHITDVHNLSYLPAEAEVLLFWFIVILSLFIKRKKATPQQSSFFLFCICFSVSFLIIAGYTITFSGAIVRYRAVVLPFLFIPLLYPLTSIKRR